MEYRTLGNSDIEVSTVGFGCWAIVGGFNWGPQDERDSIAALRAAFDAGVTFFDSAEMYGDGASEQLVGKALGRLRDQVVIASKVGPDHYAPDQLRAACERSLRHLGSDYLDLYQLHWPNREIPVAETLGLMAELRDEGKIRAIGVSNFGPRDLADALAAGVPIVSNQLAYSLLFRAIEFEILPLCVESGLSVLCYSPMLQGLLTGKFVSADDVPVDRARTRHFASTRRDARHSDSGAETATFASVEQVRRAADLVGKPMANVALAWLLEQEGVTAVIAGGRSPQQALVNAAAADLELSPDILADLAAATDALKQALGPNADMWQTDSRIR